MEGLLHKCLEDALYLSSLPIDVECSSLWSAAGGWKSCCTAVCVETNTKKIHGGKVPHIDRSTCSTSTYSKLLGRYLIGTYLVV